MRMTVLSIPRICNEITGKGIVKRYLTKIDFPIIKQMTNGPVVRFMSRKDHGSLTCQCGNELIANYIQDVFISVAIECNKCHQLTLTPKLPYGEILPTGLGILALENREHFINMPLFLPLSKVMTGNTTLAEDQSMFNPVKLPLPLKTYQEFIDDIMTFYDTLTDGCLNKHMSSVVRGLRTSRQANSEYPLPWALYYVKSFRNLSLRKMNEDKNFIAAMYFLISFHDVISRWRHHPIFKEFGKIFSGRNSFHHNVSQLTAATILVQRGNRIGLAKAVGDGIRTPDMYINFVEVGKLHIEVKAPEILQWSSTFQITDKVIGDIVKKYFQKCQINIEKPGILVIGCTRFQNLPYIERLFRESVNKIGIFYRHVAGIYLIQNKSLVIADKNESGILAKKISASQVFIVNKNYLGENPFDEKRHK